MYKKLKLDNSFLQKKNNFKDEATNEKTSNNKGCLFYQHTRWQKFVLSFLLWFLRALFLFAQRKSQIVTTLTSIIKSTTQQKARPLYCSTALPFFELKWSSFVELSQLKCYWHLVFSQQGFRPLLTPPKLTLTQDLYGSGWILPPQKWE